MTQITKDIVTWLQQWFYTESEVDNALNGKVNNADLIDTIYPIGSIYMSVNSTSPTTLFGGTWEQIQDKFLLASGTSYSNGSTGGSADAVIVSHNHKAIGYTNTSGSGSNRRNVTGYNASGITGTLDTETVGESGTGKNMPPYLVVNVWKRTA